MTRSLRLFTSLALVCVLALAASAASASASGQLGGVNLVGGGPDDENFVLSTPGETRRAPDGTLWVADSGNNRIVRLSASGKFLYAFGGSSTGDSGTFQPLSIALIPTGGDPDVLVSTAYNVKRFTATGTFISKFTPAHPGFLAIDPAWGDLYMADFNSNNVQKIALGDDACTPATEQLGDVVQTLGQGAGVSDFLQPGKLWGPHSIAFDSTGRLFVVDRNQRRVTVFNHPNHCDPWVHETQFGSNSSGNPEIMIGAQGIAIDRSVVPNKIYVTVDFYNHVVLAYTEDGTGGNLVTYRGRWGSALEDSTLVPGNGPDDLSSPGGIALNGSDAWVSERGNDRVHAFSGVSAATPFTTPTSTGLWGHSGREDGYFLVTGDLAAAPDGSLFALDLQKRRVQHFSARGTFLNAWGEDGSAVGQFSSNPNSIAVTSAGEVLVAGGSAGIQRFSASGAYLGSITWDQLSPPNEIAPGVMRVDSAGNIWLWDYSVQKILKIDPAGTILTSFGTSGFSAGDTISNAAGIAVSPDGLSVYVLDQPTNLVKKFTSQNGTNFTFAFASQATTGSGSADGLFSGPNSMALDPKTGEIVVADGGNSRVQRFAASDLSFVSKFGSYGLGDDDLIDPYGIAFDKWGNLWLGDHGGDRIKRFGDPPVVTFDSAPQSTTASSLALSYTVTDPGADCTVTSGSTVPLAIGANSFAVTCTNALGSDTKTLSVLRTVDVPAPVIVVEPTILLKKKLKLTKSKKLKFSVVCPDGCTVTPKISFGKEGSRIKQVRLAAKSSAQPVTLKLSGKQYKKALAALKKHNKVTLTVTVQSYKATQGKSGKAAVAK